MARMGSRAVPAARPAAALGAPTGLEGSRRAPGPARGPRARRGAGGAVGPPVVRPARRRGPGVSTLAQATQHPA
jgi:hypothetical protein